MGAPVEETTVINRAKLSDYQLIDNCWMWNETVKIKGAIYKQGFGDENGKV